MTTTESIEERRRLISRFVQGKMSEEQFYTMLHTLSLGNVEELDEVLAQLRRLVEEVEEAKKKP